AALTGLSTGAEIQLYRDVNDNDVLEQADLIGGTSGFGPIDRSLSRPLTAGTYYLLVYRNQAGPTDYNLAFRTFADATPPTVTMDAVETTSLSGTLTFSVIYSDNQGMDFDSIFYKSQV